VVPLRPLRTSFHFCRLMECSPAEEVYMFVTEQELSMGHILALNTSRGFMPDAIRSCMEGSEVGCFGFPSSYDCAQDAGVRLALWRR
jgi:hypothetical protein